MFPMVKVCNISVGTRVGRELCFCVLLSAHNLINGEVFGTDRINLKTCTRPFRLTDVCPKDKVLTKNLLKYSLFLFTYRTLLVTRPHRRTAPPRPHCQHCSCQLHFHCNYHLLLSQTSKNSFIVINMYKAKYRNYNVDPRSRQYLNHSKTRCHPPLSGQIPQK